MLRDAKYLLAYLIPLTTYFSINATGLGCYSTIILVFLIIPFLELLLPMRTDNLSEAEVLKYDSRIFFDWLLYMNLPILYLLLYSYLSNISGGSIRGMKRSV